FEDNHARSCALPALPPPLSTCISLNFLNFPNFLNHRIRRRAHNIPDPLAAQNQLNLSPPRTVVRTDQQLKARQGEPEIGVCFEVEVGVEVGGVEGGAGDGALEALGAEEGLHADFPGS
ncbi:hypothetical protein V501_07901, partial [Pseudogymnoascus sp. VKM F-4519 (FW-2642)]